MCFVPLKESSVQDISFISDPERTTLVNDQLDAHIFNTFITFLYTYMFRAVSCSSSGGQIVLIQHLVSSLSVSDRPVLCPGRSLTESDDTRCCINP